VKHNTVVTVRALAACRTTLCPGVGAGTLNEGSFYVDHHLTKRFDVFAGIAYSWVSGGLAIAIPHKPGVPYNSDNNCAPTVGARFAF